MCSKKEAEESACQDKIIKDSIHSAKRSYEAFILKLLLRAVDDLDVARSQAIINEFSEFIQREHKIIFNTYKKSKFNSAAVSASFKEFIKNNHQDIFNQFPDFSSYVREFYPDLLLHLEAASHEG